MSARVHPEAGWPAPPGRGGPACEVVVPSLAWRQFICRACGLVYDEAEGDPDGGLAPGTRFEDIPDDWSCPLCGVTKADFEPHDAAAVRRPASTRPPVSSTAARDAEGIVILGAGRAGWEAASALRALDTAVPITIVSACRGDVYDKPTLSIACARETPPERLVRESAADAAGRLRVRLLHGTHAVRLETATRRLRTTRGTLRYRHLVLAHGATPRPAAALPPSVCWRINDLEAYRRLRAALGTGSCRIVIVGAGLVGSELANDLALSGHAVTLLDTCERPLAAQLPVRAAERLIEAWRDLSLHFVGGLQVESVMRLADIVRVTTACGRRFEADQVIAATGLTAATGLARVAGLAVDDGGIAVETETLRTSDPRVFALGDCASVAGRAQRYIEPIGRQAQAIASAILGDGQVRFEPKAVPLRIKTGSMPITLHGVPNAHGRWSVDCDAGGELRMTQHDGMAAVARLEARERPRAR